MGAMCGKSKHFEGQGNRLDSSDPNHPATPRTTTTTTTTTTTAQPKSHPPPVRTQEEASAARRAAAAAAEARAKASASRGTTGGELSRALAQQPADGGRVNEAIAAGTSAETHKRPMVWD